MPLLKPVAIGLAVSSPVWIVLLTGLFIEGIKGMVIAFSITVTIAAILLGLLFIGFWVEEEWDNYKYRKTYL